MTLNRDSILFSVIFTLVFKKIIEIKVISADLSTASTENDINVTAKKYPPYNVPSKCKFYI